MSPSTGATPPPPARSFTVAKAMRLDILRDIRVAVDGALAEGVTRAWHNPRTGTIVQMPPGIDPGWQHNVGRVDPAIAAAKFLDDKIAAAGGRLTKEAAKPSQAYRVGEDRKVRRRILDETGSVKTPEGKARFRRILRRELKARRGTSTVDPVLCAGTTPIADRRAVDRVREAPRDLPASWMRATKGEAQRRLGQGYSFETVGRHDKYGRRLILGASMGRRRMCGRSSPAPFRNWASHADSPRLTFKGPVSRLSEPGQVGTSRSRCAPWSTSPSLPPPLGTAGVTAPRRAVRPAHTPSPPSTGALPANGPKANAPPIAVWHCPPSKQLEKPDDDGDLGDAGAKIEVHEPRFEGGERVVSGAGDPVHGAGNGLGLAPTDIDCTGSVHDRSPRHPLHTF